MILGFVSGYYTIQIPTFIYEQITKKPVLTQLKAISLVAAMCLTTTFSYKIANDRYT
jgi:hypothetical protein